MSEQKLRKFRLIDKEGYLFAHTMNVDHLEYLEDGCFIGKIEDKKDFLVGKDSPHILITKGEFQFFEEILLEEEGINQEDNIQQQPPLNAISGTFSDEMIHCIKEDCHAVNGSLCFYKEGVVFLWNEDEYFIESVDDYNKVINSIKVLNSFKK
jgi:hypothetical protein